MQPALKQYIYKALERGLAPEVIESTLLDAGWTLSMIRPTLQEYCGVDAMGLPIPSPQTPAHHIARDWFIYILTFVTLWMICFALGGVFFRFIDIWFPDTATSATYSSETIHWSIAQLIIATPVYAGLTYWTRRHLAQHPEKSDSLIRKLMLYFILAVTAITALGDITVVLQGFLRGDPSLRFILKSLVVFAISGLVFMAYWQEARQDDKRMLRLDPPMTDGNS